MRKNPCVGFVAVLAAALVLAANSPASANLFDFSYSGAGFSGQGEFITQDVGSPYQVIDVTGITTSGSTTSNIVGISTFASADNLLYFPSSSTQPYLDFFGISFTTASAGDFNLYFNSVEFTGYARISSSLDPSGTTAGTQVQFAVHGAPGPVAGAGLPGIILVGVFLLVAWRHRRTTADLVSFSLPAMIFPQGLHKALRWGRSCDSAFS
jgi:hypothetical protein